MTEIKEKDVDVVTTTEDTTVTETNDKTNTEKSDYAKVNEEINPKAEYSLSKTEAQIIEAKAELKRVKAETEALLADKSDDTGNEEDYSGLSEAKVGEIVAKALEDNRRKTESEKDIVASQKLISAVEDKDKKELIEKEMTLLNDSLSASDKFKIAEERVELLVSSKLGAKIESENGSAITPISGFSTKKDDPTADLVKQAYARAGLNL